MKRENRKIIEKKGGKGGKLMPYTSKLDMVLVISWMMNISLPGAKLIVHIY